MRLSKRIPARMKTVKLVWLKIDFLKMSPTYRRIRGKSSKPMDACYWCRHSFADGEMMALACVEGKGNQVFCQACAQAAKGDGDE